MMIDPNQIEIRSAELDALLAETSADEISPTLLSTAMTLARDALQLGRGELTVSALERLVHLAPMEAGAWHLLGFVYGEAQRIIEAAAAFDRAARLRPDEPVTALARAQAHLDAGFAAANLFEVALALAPQNMQAVGGWAAALTAQGDRAAAASLLAETLRHNPGWLVGHRKLTALRFTSGDSQFFADSYAQACDAQPQHLQLRLAWFTAIAQTRDWDAALKIIVDGERLIGTAAAFRVGRAYVASESGDHILAERLFAGAASIRDDALGIARLRHCLRTAQPEKAESLALDLIDGPSAPMVWPYLSLIWRLRGDARAAWLDGSPPFIRIFDLQYTAAELQELVGVLQRIHMASAPYLEQSVRGGAQTDTDRQLFFRAEAAIQSVRSKVCAAIREYVRALPPHLPGHPLLGAPRERIRFSGSWSVRLQSRGFHVSHTHPMGWISSALYVSLPEPAQLGPAPAGWIRFGCPPLNLGFDLPPYAEVEPKPGRLVLFPSTMWHQTVPFDDGERLVIAFDVMK